MTFADGSAEGDSPVPEREVSSLHPSLPPPQAAKQGVGNSPDKKKLLSSNTANAAHSGPGRCQ